MPSRMSSHAGFPRMSLSAGGQARRHLVQNRRKQRNRFQTVAKMPVCGLERSLRVALWKFTAGEALHWLN